MSNAVQRHVGEFRPDMTQEEFAQQLQEKQQRHEEFCANSPGVLREHHHEKAKQHAEALAVQPDNFVKTVFVGDAQVGKTCLLMRLTTDQFPNDSDGYVPKVLDRIEHAVDVDGHPVRVGLEDTVGYEGYDNLRPLSYPGTGCVVMCFSLVSRSTFANIGQRWHPELKHHLPAAAFVLMGLKRDLRADEGTVARLRDNDQVAIGADEARKLARELGAVAYVETSSLEDSADNLSEICRLAFRAAQGSKATKPFKFIVHSTCRSAAGQGKQCRVM